MWEWTPTHYDDIGVGPSASELTEHSLRQPKANGKPLRSRFPCFQLCFCTAIIRIFLKKAIKMHGLHVAGTVAKWLIGKHKCLLITPKKRGIKSKALHRNINLWSCSVTILEGFPFSGVLQFGVSFFLYGLSFFCSHSTSFQGTPAWVTELCWRVCELGSYSKIFRMQLVSTFWRQFPH